MAEISHLVLACHEPPAELRWKEMLAAFLPQRYIVSKGFVVDSAGQRSDQIDVIIHDHFFSPLLWEDGGHMYIPAEGVYAIFEVKQDHSLEHITYAGQKAASVRRRVRTEGEFGWLNGIAKRNHLPFQQAYSRLILHGTQRLATLFIRRLTVSLRMNILILVALSSGEAGIWKTIRIREVHN